MTHDAPNPDMPFYDSLTRDIPTGHCFMHGSWYGPSFRCPKCALGWIGQNPPPGWKSCPRCMGSGMTSADE